MRIILAVSVFMGGLMHAHADEPPITAKWIWANTDFQSSYNDTIEASYRFPMDRPVLKAEMRITADSFYRLFINGEWVNDGPCRSWPSHYQYDVIDVTKLLKEGENEIKVIAKYYGVGTFHQIPQEPGLLVQLDITDANKKLIRIESDGTWMAVPAQGWVSSTPKKCIQMGPFEVYDSRFKEVTPDSYFPGGAKVVISAHDGPWKDLNPRDVKLMTRTPFPLKSFVGASLVNKHWRCYTFPTARFLYPELIEANGKVSMASATATIIDATEAMTLHIEAPRCTVTINGDRGKDGAYQLRKGENFLFMVVSEFFGHWNKDTQIRFVETSGYVLRNPKDGNEEYPWCIVPFEDAKYVNDDYHYALLPAEERAAIEKKIRGIVNGHIEKVVDRTSFERIFGKSIVPLDWTGWLMHDIATSDDPHWQFVKREVIKPADTFIENPSGLIHGGDDDATIVSPAPDGDIELLYDLGEQNVGYYDFEIEGESGLTVDVAQVEYIASDGRVQHTGDYRNAFRYICHEGTNKFTSLERRAGRFVFITLRYQTKPANIRHFQLIESTYPVEPIGRFACSDPDFDKIWEISARTLKLCMEDTYTDCPLYEQTHWVGDARNEAIFGFTAFGAEDLAKRCVRLTAYSLEKYPIALCQTPSTWDILLPAWSFLWGISVWDYYEYTGDEAFLREMWPYVKKNLEGARQLRDERGLFSGPFWNMFDWSGIDDGHHTVTHNSMFVVGAIDAALKCAAVVGDKEAGQWLRAYREELVPAINALWVEERQAYADSVHAGGTLSPKSSVHTSFLALLYDIAGTQTTKTLLAHVLDPPADMVKVGSPFAIMYQYEALEKLGKHEAIIQSIRDNYTPMIRDGATTVWESFPSGTTGSGGFPTRSHCHAWSSAPVHFLNRIVLGIMQTEVGGKAFEISPRPSGLTWASGASASMLGPIEVDWKLDGNTTTIVAKAPEGVALSFKKNPELENVTVVFNGIAQSN